MFVVDAYCNNRQFKNRKTTVEKETHAAVYQCQTVQLVFQE